MPHGIETLLPEWSYYAFMIPHVFSCTMAVVIRGPQYKFRYDLISGWVFWTGFWLELTGICSFDKIFCVLPEVCHSNSICDWNLSEFVHFLVKILLFAPEVYQLGVVFGSFWNRTYWNLCFSVKFVWFLPEVFQFGVIFWMFWPKFVFFWVSSSDLYRSWSIFNRFNRVLIIY
jgi:hypothetical protein